MFLDPCRGLQWALTIQLDILVSEITLLLMLKGAYHSLQDKNEIGPSTSFEEKVRLAQGTQALIFTVAVEAKLRPYDIPDLVLLPDVSFDEINEQNGVWERMKP